MEMNDLLAHVTQRKPLPLGDIWRIFLIQRNPHFRILRSQSLCYPLHLHSPLHHGKDEIMFDSIKYRKISMI